MSSTNVKQSAEYLNGCHFGKVAGLLQNELMNVQGHVLWIKHNNYVLKSDPKHSSVNKVNSSKPNHSSNHHVIKKVEQGTNRTVTQQCEGCSVVIITVETIVK